MECVKRLHRNENVIISNMLIEGGVGEQGQRTSEMLEKRMFILCMF